MKVCGHCDCSAYHCVKDSIDLNEVVCLNFFPRIRYTNKVFLQEFILKELWRLNLGTVIFDIEG